MRSWAKVANSDLPIAWEAATGRYAGARCLGGRIYLWRASSLCCHRALDGAHLWTADVGGEITSGPESAGTHLAIGLRDGVALLDCDSGQRFWRLAHAGGSSFQRPVFTPEYVLTSACEQKLFALDRATGLLRWQTGIRGFGLPTRACTAPGGIAVGFLDQLVLLDQRGRERWRLEIEKCRAQSLHRGGDRIVLAGAATDSARIVTADFFGQMIWRKDFARRLRACFADAEACYLIFETKVCALDLRDGKFRWELAVGERNPIDAASMPEPACLALWQPDALWLVQSSDGKVFARHSLDPQKSYAVGDGLLELGEGRIRSRVLRMPGSAVH